MGNWVNIKPKFNKECLLLTVSFYGNTTYYNSWWITKCEDIESGGWYWGLCTIDGEEWGDINDLSADLYKTVNIPPKP